MKVFLTVLLVVLLAVALFTACNYVFTGKPEAGSTPASMPAISGAADIPTPSPTPILSASPSAVPSPTASEAAVPLSWEDSGIFSESYQKAYTKLLQMTLQEKVGQMILAGCPAEGALQSIQDYHLGGFVLFGQDFKDKTSAEVISAIRSYQDASKIPMIMAVDEEGGTIVRISSNPKLASKPFLSPQQVYAKGGLAEIKTDTVNKAKLLKKLGLNVNLAPVADVSQNPKDYIYTRTLGKPPKETGRYVAAVVAAIQGQGLSSALKHFPGYGNNKNTHTGISIDSRSLASFEKNDFIPFEYGINAGAESILVSHNIVQSMEKNVPASLSPNVHKILRNDLKFTGIIMTDDLSMDAIKDYTNKTDPSVLAVLAGNDMLLTKDFAQSYAQVLNAVNAGVISQDTVDHAVFRILAWKYSKNILTD